MKTIKNKTTLEVFRANNIIAQNAVSIGECHYVRKGALKHYRNLLNKNKDIKK